MLCIDEGSCDLENVGLPSCSKACGIRHAVSSTKIWANILKIAKEGNPASIRIVNRVNLLFGNK